MTEQKLNGETMDIVKENIESLKKMFSEDLKKSFPDIVCDDKIDFEKLRQVLGDYVETENERYNFSWNGKGRALRLAQSTSTGTLRPCVEESKNWDTTGNFYILKTII